MCFRCFCVSVLGGAGVSSFLFGLVLCRVVLLFGSLLFFFGWWGLWFWGLVLCAFRRLQFGGLGRSTALTCP